MIQIRPVSDLRNKFTEIEKLVNEGQPVFLTKNGYGSMVVMSIEQYSAIGGHTEATPDRSDEHLKGDSPRLTEDEVFGGIRRGPGE